MESKILKVDTALKQAEISKTASDIKTNELSKELDKIQVLSDLLQAITIDSENTIMASEPKFKSVFDNVDQEKIKDKIFDIINRI